MHGRVNDALHENPEVDGILALHEGAVAGMAGGYTQVKNDPAVMVVHLGAGLAQALGQMCNIWNARLPVVVITHASDTGSGTDRTGWGVIPNNQAYGVVARSFASAGGTMKKTGEYAGVFLDSIDPLKIAEGYGVDGIHVTDESRVGDAFDRGLEVVGKEGRPFILNVHLPMGIPEGGRPAKPFHFSG